MESFTEAKAASKAAAVQAKSVPTAACVCSVTVDHNDVAISGVAAPRLTLKIVSTAAITTDTSIMPASSKTGRARFHGNGMGGGADASLRTASITEVVKPEEGWISSRFDSMRSNSLSFIFPPATIVSSSDVTFIAAIVPMDDIPITLDIIVPVPIIVSDIMLP